MHEMQTILTDVCGVSLSDCLSRGLNRLRRMQCKLRAMCMGGHSVQPSSNYLDHLLFRYFHSIVSVLFIVHISCIQLLSYMAARMIIKSCILYHNSHAPIFFFLYVYYWNSSLRSLGLQKSPPQTQPQSIQLCLHRPPTRQTNDQTD